MQTQAKAKMKGMTRLFGLTAVLSGLLVLTSVAQDCNNFHKRKCYSSDNAFMRYNTQSKSGMFVLGHTSDLVFVAHAGQDYNISLCQEKKVEEPLKFQVIDGRSQDVLFDNQNAALDVPVEEGADPENTLPQSFEFTADATKKIIIRITAPGPPPEEGSDKKGRKDEPNPDDLFCVGVLVENMPTPMLGF